MGQPTLCPVSAILAYMMKRGQGPDPLFCFDNGQALTGPALVYHIKEALEAVRASSVGISGYSFRIGAATTVTENAVWKIW